MKLTIGMAVCGNYAEAWFTVQALRLYHGHPDIEILVVDNSEGPEVQQLVEGWAHRDARFVRYLEKRGTAPAKEQVVVNARGEWIICLDSHVLLAPGAITDFLRWTEAHPDCVDLLHGPMLYDDLITAADAMNDEWRGGMWGTWRQGAGQTNPYEIPMHGMGLFACRRDSWLHFNPGFSGFGGEEGYIHAKYHAAGRKVLCLPFLKWLHFFRKGPAPYEARNDDKIRNYLIGFRELGWNPQVLFEQFGDRARQLAASL